MTPIDQLPRTKSFTIQKFKKLGIETYEDLVYHFPFRYEDYSVVSQIKDVQEGEVVTVRGQVETADTVYTRRGLKIQKVSITESTGTLQLVWYNQPYLMQVLKKGLMISVSGTIKRYIQQISMQPTEYEIVKNGQTTHTGRIIPIYPEVQGLSSRTIREKVQYVLTNSPQFEEWLPNQIRDTYHLIPTDVALRTIHFPPDMESLKDARDRLGFDEFFTIQLATHLIKKEWQKEAVGHQYLLDKNTTGQLEKLIQSLPFPLTTAQKKVIDQIMHDLQKKTPMNRFLQGDVGSGKTIVAALASYATYLNSYQTLYMAPTEILAQQHYQTFTTVFKNLPVKIGLQTGSNKAVAKKDIAHTFDILIGTQALLNTVKGKKIGLVIIDEQHRFGVTQRAILKQKGLHPHLLTMTATPIPRTIALTLYGELEMSILDEMPTGRIPIKTYVVPAGKRASAYEWIKKQIRTGDQVFIICPLIEQSDTETLQSVKAATKEYERLKNVVFPEFKVSLLHGRMKSQEKASVMRSFKDKTNDILVSTSVVEVGIDIPNASIMIIEGAERFGMAQLHQLRGRVGRGDQQSYCLVFSDAPDPRSQNRLAFFAKTNNGLPLAEYDLKVRGPGQMFGTQQHGYAELKIASFSDLPLIEKTKHAVRLFVDTYNAHHFPALEKRIQKFRIDQIAHD